MVAEPQHAAVADEISADAIARREPLMRNDPLINDPPSRRDSQIRRAPNGAGLYDVLDLILDKGIVIDGFVRVSLVGIELLTIDLRIVVASVDTYLRYAEGVERLGVYKTSHPTKIPDMVKGGMKGHALKKGTEKLLGQGGEGEEEGGEGEEEGEQEEGVAGKLAQGVRNVMRRGVRGIVSRLAGDDEGEQQEDDEADERDQAHGSQAATARHHHQRSAGNGHHARSGGGGGDGGGSGRGRSHGRAGSAKR
jgi:hypothetical protein